MDQSKRDVLSNLFGRATVIERVQLTDHYEYFIRPLADGAKPFIIDPRAPELIDGDALCAWLRNII